MDIVDRKTPGKTVIKQEENIQSFLFILSKKHFKGI